MKTQNSPLRRRDGEVRTLGVSLSAPLRLCGENQLGTPRQPYPKMNVGRRGLPDHVVAEMYADYQRLSSLAAAGKLHNRTRQSMYCILSARGLPLNPVRFHPQVKYKGRKFTPGKGGYLRDTIFRRGKKQGETQLHRIVWTEHNGPIPPGHQVTFKDGNKLNWKIGNLLCLPVAAVSSLKATGANQFTLTAKARLGMLMRNHETGSGTLAAQIKREAAC